MNMTNPYTWLPLNSTASPKTQSIEFEGPAGWIEVLFDNPSSPSKGIVLIAHPQPLLGGSPRHKIPHTLAQTLKASGWTCLRPYFRGVGNTEGRYDHGTGETQDLLAIIATLRAHNPATALILIGFSFGAYVIAKVAHTLQQQGAPAQTTILLSLPAGTVDAGRAYDTGSVPANSLIIHGEADLQVPLRNVLIWAGSFKHPIVVFPGADHFFKGHEKTLIQKITEAIK
ncbi:alpha/beta hydrolase [Advenella mandrilli]|uniref:alpha/beta hydrolase n=1 Tax=Advenella mandrilli TaxID=2800330 RepID=UPI001F205CE3|nr:alpha/beta fold hydrolase [Advenella mandrilli]